MTFAVLLYFNVFYFMFYCSLELVILLLKVRKRNELSFPQYIIFFSVKPGLQLFAQVPFQECDRRPPGPALHGPGGGGKAHAGNAAFKGTSDSPHVDSADAAFMI